MEPAIAALFEANGLAAPTAAVPLSGGVSCDVWRVESGGKSYAVKRALPRLRTGAEWLAPVERAESEVRWLQLAERIVPGLVPHVVATDPATHSFAMTFLTNAPVWKDELVAGRIDPVFAAAVGRGLVAIHAATAGDAWVVAQFETDALFDALRIDPFLRYVAVREPELAPTLTAIADSLSAAGIALVHGDVSPKNILVGKHGPVLLDAECAVYGDPAFDLAFCVTHLLLKAVWLKQGDALIGAARALVDAYRKGVTWERWEILDRRAADLTAALLLARVVGKSPAPYLTDPGDRTIVYDNARRLLAKTGRGTDALFQFWATL